METISSASSGLLDSSAIVATGSTHLTGVLVVTDGTNPATVTVFEGTDGTGKVLAGTLTLAGASNHSLLSFAHPVAAQTGLYVAISGTGAKAVIYYKDKDSV